MPGFHGRSLTPALALLVLPVALAANPVSAAAKNPAPPDVLRAGGPSAPGDPKVAILGSRKDLSGRRFTVTVAGGGKVMSGKLKKARGSRGVFAHVQRAVLTPITEPGTYTVRAAGLKSRTWKVVADPVSRPIQTILGFFAMNSDGTEAPASLHGPAHLNDAVVDGGGPIPITGGWMDSGDMIHFTQTTAFNASLLLAAARLLPPGPDRAAVDSSAAVGVRWLEKAHPAPGVFIGQVGDARDHDQGFRDPAKDDASGKPGIGTRVAYPLEGGDLGGKAATALALAAERAASARRAELIAQAEDWYAMGKASGRAAPSVNGFYEVDLWKDSMAAGAAALFRVTGDATYLAEAFGYLGQTEVSGELGYGSFAPFAAADLCGALGAPGLGDATAVGASCDRFREEAEYARDTGREEAFGRAGYYAWGTTAANSAAGAVAALGGKALGVPGGIATGAGARDWLFGRNAWGQSFVVGFGPRSPKFPHHWASVFGNGKPVGAIVGGPAPLGQVKGEGFKDPGGPFDTKQAVYEDRRGNYVTSEPTGDSAASAILLLAALASAG